jgi:tRNA A37 threonylcarbamoyltransferase TsaD
LRRLVAVWRSVGEIGGRCRCRDIPSGLACDKVGRLAGLELPTAVVLSEVDSKIYMPYIE